MTALVVYVGTLKATNAVPSPLSVRIHDAPTPWLYRGANLELVQLVTSSLICIAALVALFWMMT